MAMDWLNKVRGLLDKAESTEALGNAAEAAMFRAKAEELMAKYRIEMEDLLAAGKVVGLSYEPEYKMFELSGYTSEYQQAYVNLFHVVARHVGARVAYRIERVDGKGYMAVAHAVGYGEDLAYAEMLFTAARLVFSERLEPQVLANLSEQENVYRLRGAGIERVRVAEMVWGNRDKANLAKVGRMYKAECAKRGERPALDGRGVTGKVYREQYAQEFPWALGERLRRAQDAAGQMGGGLVLHGRQERVDEAFYSRYPEYRPHTEIEQATEAQCERCQAAKKRKKDDDATCRDHAPYKPTAADRARSARYNSPTARAGRAAGMAAAAHVELSRNGKAQVDDGGRGDVEHVAFGEVEG
jgi:hypothetical protein